MIGALIMVHGDDNGLILPPKIAPTQVAIIEIGDDLKVKALAETYYEKLKAAGISVVIDDSDKTPGFKFAEAEVNGIPIRIEIGARDLENDHITIARRDTREKALESKDIDIVSYVNQLMKHIQDDLFERAKKNLEAKTFKASTMEEVEAIMDKQPGFIHAPWCGNLECELKMKEIKGTKSRCILDDDVTGKKCVCCGEDAKHLVVWGIQY